MPQQRPFEGCPVNDRIGHTAGRHERQLTGTPRQAIWLPERRPWPTVDNTAEVRRGGNSARRPSSLQLVLVPKQVTEFLFPLCIGGGCPWYALWIFLRNSVLPIGCRVGCTAKPPIHLLRNMLVRKDRLVVPMQV